MALSLAVLSCIVVLTTSLPVERGEKASSEDGSFSDEPANDVSQRANYDPSFVSEREDFRLLREQYASLPGTPNRRLLAYRPKPRYGPMGRVGGTKWALDPFNGYDSKWNRFESVPQYEYNLVSKRGSVYPHGFAGKRDQYGTDGFAEEEVE